MKILIFRPGALGDLIVTLPLLQSIRNFDPTGILHVIAHPSHRTLLRYGHADGDASSDDPDLAFLYSEDSHPAGSDRAWPPRSARPGTIPPPALWGAFYDGAIVVTRNAEDSIMACLSRMGIQRLVHCCSFPEATGSMREHIAAALGDLLSPGFGSTHPHSATNPPDSVCPDSQDFPLAGKFHPRWPFAKSTGDFPVRNRHRTEGPWILHAGAGSPAKQASIELFQIAAQHARAHGKGTVLLEGPADEAPTDLLYRHFRSAGIPVEKLRVDSAVQAAEILLRGSFFVGNDSGITHLAAACGLPGLGLFGPTDPVLWNPGGSIVALAGENRTFPRPAVLQAVLHQLEVGRSES